MKQKIAEKIKMQEKVEVGVIWWIENYVLDHQN